MYLFILFTVVIQVLLYNTMNRQGFGKWKWAVCGALLLGHAVLFPPLFYPEPEFDDFGMRCGMPIVGITIAFCIFGGGATLLTHLIYFLIKRKKIIFNKR